RVDTGLAETEITLAAALQRWDREKAFVAEILELRARLRGEGVPLDPVETPESNTATAGSDTVEAQPPKTEAPKAEVPKTKTTKAKTARLM
ncbi:hypothetical protein, partial [Mesorhizobium sp. M2E.F.Ca.ET.154.01.1.1]|uniref:hypothetical protein n=1 Tax=Mesorhizobium sp. M2E.F.Ca.ET.154.01.1.1 TaxID=2500521 RepID=UPI001092BC7D